MTNSSFVDGSVRTLLRVVAGGKRFALPLKAVREIVPMALLARPPGIPSFVEGFLHLGGSAVAVLQPGLLLGFAPTPPRLHTPLVVLRGGAAPAALLVDRVEGVWTAPPGAMVPLSAEDTFNGCAVGAFRDETGVIHELAPERILLEQERRRLDEFQAVEQRRVDGLAAPAGEGSPA